MKHSDIYTELIALAHSIDEHVENFEIAEKLRDLADRVSPQYREGFFEVTGASEELPKIILAIEQNDGRLSAGSSADLDLWQEMLEKWFKIHDKRIENATLAWTESHRSFEPRIEID